MKFATLSPQNGLNIQERIGKERKQFSNQKKKTNNLLKVDTMSVARLAPDRVFLHALTVWIFRLPFFLPCKHPGRKSTQRPTSTSPTRATKSTKMAGFIRVCRRANTT